MKFRKIRNKMLVFILPIIVVSLLVLTCISAISCDRIVEQQIAKHMSSELDAKSGAIRTYLLEVQDMATTISHTVENSYQTLTLEDYEKMLGRIIQENDIVMGSGIWFEPYAYDQQQEYVGPYIYKGEDGIEVTYDYSNAEYDYFNQEYYMLAKENKEAVITDPYYDETSGVIMSSCTMPLYDDTHFLGCVTVDIELSSVEEVVESVKVGEGGSAFLLTADGTYIAGVDLAKIEAGEAITDESNETLANAGKKIFETEDGITQYTEDGEDYNLYFTTVGVTPWKIVIKMSQSELFDPIISLIIKLAVVCLIAIACAVLVVVIQISSISKGIQRVQKFAEPLSQGDFTIEQLPVNSRDELAHMSEALNEMYSNNKDIIRNIANHSISIKDASNHLTESAETLVNEFEGIEKGMAQINEAMVSTSAATEQVNASAEEVNSSAAILAEETEQSLQTAQEIKRRAEEVERKSRASYDSATALSSQIEGQLEVSIQNARVVENIGEMANVIADIADQINLLSLNASIEAARAGEQGKGFAVVAGEIGALAGDTANAVNSIQETIEQVQEAFQSLSDNAKELVAFVQNTVAPDYHNFVDTANQYGMDADHFASISGKVSEMTVSITHIMNEVSEGIQSIAESTQETAEVSVHIKDSVENVSASVENVSHMAEKQFRVSEELDDVVQNFKLD